MAAFKPHVAILVVAGLVALSLSAAGQSLQAPPPGDELDVTSYEVVYRLPGMDKVEVRAGLPFVAAGGAELHLDLYLPAARLAGVKVPVVVFVNGVGLPALKDWTIYRSWGRLVAAAGMAAVTFEARRPTVDADIAALFAALGEKAASWGVDPDRVAMWSCSGNVPAALRYAMGTAPGVRALVAYYGASVVDRIRADLPVLLVRAGRDAAELLDGEALLAGGAIGATAPSEYRKDFAGAESPAKRFPATCSRTGDCARSTTFVPARCASWSPRMSPAAEFMWMTSGLW